MTISRRMGSKDQLMPSDLWSMLAPRAVTIAITGIIGALLSFGGSFLFAPIYSADVLLAPANTSGDGLSSMLGGQAGSLASLAGVSLLSGRDGGQKEEAIATLQSRLITNVFIRDYRLMPKLYDKKTVVNPEAIDAPFGAGEPTIWDAEILFDKKIRSVVTDKKNGLVLMSIRWRDPVEAAAWATELVSRTNDHLRNKAITQASRNLEFLQKQLESVAIVEIRQSVFKLMESEIKTLTLAQGATDYAFKIIDPAVIPGRKIFPKRATFVVAGLLLGLATGIAYALIRGGATKS